MLRDTVDFDLVRSFVEEARLATRFHHLNIANTYSLGKQLRHAISTVLSQSTRPLYASVAFGFTAAVGAAIAALYLVIRRLMGGSGVEGWTSVIVSLWFLFGVLFLNLGVLGLYLGSVFDEVKGRPPFVIEQTTYGQGSGVTTSAGSRRA